MKRKKVSVKAGEGESYLIKYLDSKKKKNKGAALPLFEFLWLIKIEKKQRRGPQF